MKVEKVEDIAGMTVGVTRGSVEDLELTKVAPPTADIKRYEDNNSTISAFLSGQVKVVATGNVVAAAILARNPPKKPMVKVLIKNSPCFVGLQQGRAEAAREGQRRPHRRQGRRRAGEDLRKRLGAPLPKDL